MCKNILEGHCHSLSSKSMFKYLYNHDALICEAQRFKKSAKKDIFGNSRRASLVFLGIEYAVKHIKIQTASRRCRKN